MRHHWMLFRLPHEDDNGTSAIFANWQENVEFMFAQPAKNLTTALSSLSEDLEAVIMKQ